MGDLSAKRNAFSGYQDELIRWRIQTLLRAGVEPARAEDLACDPAYDLHKLLDLIDRGCPVELAVRILAPLDIPRLR
jgi:hypothetical protein